MDRSYLFLDIDGVMIPLGEKAIAADCAANLRAIVSSVPGIGIVISSTWRAPPIERLLRVWRAAGLRESWIVGVTPDLSRHPHSMPDKLRGQEIAAWLAANAAGSTRYAILDDQVEEIEPLFAPGVIFATKGDVGLTRGIATEIIRCLKGVASG